MLCLFVITWLSLYSFICTLGFVPSLCSVVHVVQWLPFSLSTSLLCLSRILFLDACMFCALVECWTCKWHFAFKLISLHVRLFIPSVNEHYGHYSIVITCMVKPWFITLFHFAWSHCACFVCITSFLHTIIILCCCVSGDTCSYGSRASKILDLGVSNFCSTVPNAHVKSIVCFRVLSRNSQKGKL